MCPLTPRACRPRAPEDGDDAPAAHRRARLAAIRLGARPYRRRPLELTSGSGDRGAARPYEHQPEAYAERLVRRRRDLIPVRLASAGMHLRFTVRKTGEAHGLPERFLSFCDACLLLAKAAGARRFGHHLSRRPVHCLARKEEHVASWSWCGDKVGALLSHSLPLSLWSHLKGVVALMCIPLTPRLLAVVFEAQQFWQDFGCRGRRMKNPKVAPLQVVEKLLQLAQGPLDHPSDKRRARNPRFVCSGGQDDG